MKPGFTSWLFCCPLAGGGVRPDANEEEAAEARLLLVSQLFVAMTRARDLLLVSSVGEPSEVLTPWLSYFDEVEVT